VSKHWRPDDKVVRGPWTDIETYSREVDAAAPRRVVPVVIGAVVLGLVVAGLTIRTGRSLRAAKSDATIEWKAVQAAPRR
jgi:hypothetical protein